MFLGLNGLRNFERGGERRPRARSLFGPSVLFGRSGLFGSALFRSGRIFGGWGFGRRRSRLRGAGGSEPAFALGLRRGRLAAGIRLLGIATRRVFLRSRSLRV